MDWFSWHLANFSFWLKGLFLFNDKAIKEVEALDEKESVLRDKVQNGGPTPYEGRIANKYFDFYEKNISLPLIKPCFTVLILTVLIYSLRSFLPVEIQNSQYFQYGFYIVLGITIGLLLFALFRKKEDKIDEKEARKAEDWLYYASEESRTPMPSWAILVVFVLLIVEAWAISVIAISFMGDFDRATQNYVGFAAGVVFAIILGIVTHKAGASLYALHHRAELKGAMNSNSKIKKKLNKILTTFSSDMEISHPIIRRYGFMIATCFSIIAIATVAFIQRESLNFEIIESQYEDVVAENDLLLDSPQLPAEITDAQKSSADAAVGEKKSNAIRGMHAALFLLTFIFIGANVVGMMFGYRYSFFNDTGHDAYKIIQRKKRRDMVRQIIINKANIVLSLYFDKLIKHATGDSKSKILNALGKRGCYTLSPSGNEKTGSKKHNELAPEQDIAVKESE